ncbi:MAG: TVP38/TMEM64 family protein [Proteobacteria bacterium]|nr:TVP38/TMEM64 family protein [Pseudomonadota bacterium]
MDTAPNRFGKMKRLVLLAFFVAGAVIVWRLWDLRLLTSAGVLQAATEHALLAPLVFVGAYALAVLFMLPTLPLNIGAGFLWGPFLGGIYSLFGSTLGAVGAFLFARTTFGQPMARQFKGRIIKKLATSLEDGGWKVVAFARLNPAVPTSIVNFLFGLTSLPLWTYTWVSFVFFFPLCYAFSYLGFYTGGFMLDGDMSRIVRIIVVSLGIGLLILGGRHLLQDTKESNGPDAT